MLPIFTSGTLPLLFAAVVESTISPSHHKHHPSASIIAASVAIESTASSSSVAISYAKYGVNSGISTWACHCRDISIDSVSSDFPGMHLGRPGIGDGSTMLLTLASPPEKLEISDSHSAQILDDE